VDSCYFDTLTETAEYGRYRSGPATEGPWAPHLQHGGPPNALVVAAAERLVAAETQRSDLIGMRLATDFVGPVPVAEIETHAKVVRAARGAVLAEVTLTAGDRQCLNSRVWLVRDSDTAHLAAPLAPKTDVPDIEPGLGINFGYGRSLEWRVTKGGLREQGPGATWARAATALKDDHTLSGLQLAALVGDSASGISSALDWSVWSFLNIDLDIHLARPVRGEWLFMDAATQLGERGGALARSTLSDQYGLLGSTLQTLVVAPLRK